jgi:hypothetical protein
MNRSQRLGVFVGLILVAAGLVWSLLPYQTRFPAGTAHITCSPALLGGDARGTFARGGLDSDLRRNANDACSDRAVVRVGSGLGLGALGLVIAIGAVVLLGDPANERREDGALDSEASTFS